MEVYRISSRLFLLLGILCLVTTLQGVQGGVESEGPSESECRPYIEKALKELETAEAAEPIPPGDSGGDSTEEEEGTEEVEEEISTVEITTDDSDHLEGDGENADNDIEAEESTESTESATIDEAKEDGGDDHSEEERAEETSSESQKITSTESEAVDAADQVQSVDEHEEETTENEESDESPQTGEVEETAASEEVSAEAKEDGSDETDNKSESAEAEASVEDQTEAADEGESVESDKSAEDDQDSVEIVDDAKETKSAEDGDEEQQQGDESQSEEDHAESTEAEAEAESSEAEGSDQKSAEQEDDDAETKQESAEEDTESAEGTDQQSEEATEQESVEEERGTETPNAGEDEDDKSVDDEVDGPASVEEGQSGEDADSDIVHEGHADKAEDDHSKETAGDDETVGEGEPEADSKSEESDGSEDANVEEHDSDDQSSKDAEASEETISSSEVKEVEKEEEQPQGDEPQVQEESKEEEGIDAVDEAGLEEMAGQDEDAGEEQSEENDEKEKEFTPEEELINEGEIPDNLRPTDHIWQLLKLDDDNLQIEKIMNGVAEITLRDLKKLYENAIKPLETLYKYRDLSNRHFGDSEIFSKPLVLFMGPWSGGKSSIINYLLNNEYNETSLRTGAEPSPAYFNILMYGDEPEVVDGTQLAADFTFSGLQKFGQGLEERLRGLKLPQKLLQKINIVEIPGILEVRKQISRVFPFNDACQWFIDRADIIFLVYDPSKLDVGPETEAILDQLKGREHQTRIILNKADHVKPEELMRVQGALIWNISPLMSSAQPPVMYTTSLWSKPYETGAPIRLLQAQERAFLRDLRTAVDKRIENKIASARRFAVRVRNHAKMVDCYLTTYYNHKSVFGNRKQVSDAIIEHPQDYHIYEGLSTLTNISRYDLPDPDVYRDFFRLNPLYDFQQLSATCTYFRGCPINRLDVAIAYDLPELVGKHKRMIESALAQANLAQTPSS